MSRPRFAELVVWRHPCDCDHASRPLDPGEVAEHRFDVDGEPFPWHITEEGATFRKIGSLRPVYLVTVQVFPLAVANNELLRVIIDRDEPLAFEYVDGTRRPFPWALADQPITTTLYPRGFPVTELTFIAEHVDADCDIPEEP